MYRDVVICQRPFISVSWDGVENGCDPQVFTKCSQRISDPMKSSRSHVIRLWGQIEIQTEKPESDGRLDAIDPSTGTRTETLAPYLGSPPTDSPH